MSAQTLRVPTPTVDGHLSRADLLRRAAELVPVIAAREPAAIQRRDIDPETIDDFRKAGFFRVLQPRRFGGLEGEFETFSRIVEELTLGCAASAWVYAVLGEHQWIVASFPEQAQIDVWGDDPETLVSSSLAPRAVAERVEGGYRLTGRWPFSSGSTYAGWAIVNAACPVDGAAPQNRFMLVPMADLTIVDDWQVMGLRATGSRTLALTDVFIPDYRTIAQSAMDSGTTPGRAVHPDFHLLRAPRGLFALYSQPPVVISLGGRALAMVIEALRDRVSLGTIRMAQSEDVQIRLAECAAEIDVARVMLHLGRERATALHQGPARITSEDTATLRRDIAFAQRQVRNAVQRLCEINGVGWAYDSDPLQAILRDVLVALGHVAASWPMAMRPYGRLKLHVDNAVIY